MGNSYYSFSTTPQGNIRNAVLALTLGYVATWRGLGSGGTSETVLELGTQYPNRVIKLRFPKGDKPVELVVQAASYELQKLLTGWATPALIAARNEFAKWATKGDTLEA